MTPGCRVEPEVSRPSPNDGPLATTARGRTLESPSPSPATTTSAPGAAPTTWATSASRRVTASARSGWVTGSAPPSTSTTGHSTLVGTVSEYVDPTDPSGSAAPIAAPAPLLCTHAPDAATASASSPGLAS